jgi:uncharacterized cupredoxin-like copper-binding protein
VRSRVTNGLRILAVLSAIGLPGVAAVGCASAGRAAGLVAPVIPVTEGDFHINAPSTLKTGDYTFRVHNEGPTDHEFIIVPTASGTLPLRPDGLTVDEEAVEHSEPGSLEPGGPGAVRDLTVHLKPGRYVLFCNMEGHYMAGMHTELTVR